MSADRRILIDTSLWIEAMRARGDEAARAQVAAALKSGRAVFCHATRLELRAGVSDRERRWLGELEETLETVPTTDEAWDLALLSALELRRRGLTVPAVDLIIASVAKVHDLELLHRDAHFEAIAARSESGPG